MRVTSQVLRATQTMTSPESSRILAEAAKRVSQRQRSRSRGLRKYSDLIVVGLATAVAATAVKNKRTYTDNRERMELKIEQLEEERDLAVRENDLAQETLLQNVREGVQAARSGGEQGLQVWIRSVLKDTQKPNTENLDKPRVN
ncbi:unnamed protein product [Agarophyton chilense]